MNKENNTIDTLNRNKAMKNFFYNYGIVIALIMLFVIFSFLSPVFFSSFNIINILRQVSIIGIIACGLTLVMIMGEIDLSFAAMVAFLGVCAAMWQGSELTKGLLGSNIFEMPIWLVIICVLTTGAILGIIVGIIIVKVRVSAFLVTLGAMAIYTGAALLYSGNRGVTGLKESYKIIGQGDVLGFPIITIIFVVVILILSLILIKTKLGRYIYAVGDNINAAYFAGISVNKIKVIVFGIMGLTVAIASICLTSRLNSAPPKPQPYYLIDAISACIIGGVSLSGGVGNVGRTVIGVLILGVIYNGLTILGVPIAYQHILKGLIIIGAIVLDSLKNRREGF